MTAATTTRFKLIAAKTGWCLLILIFACLLSLLAAAITIVECGYNLADRIGDIWCQVAPEIRSILKAK